MFGIVSDQMFLIFVCIKTFENNLEIKLFLHGKLPKREKLKMQQILLKSRFEALAYKYDGRTICESEYSRLPKNTDLGFSFLLLFNANQ